MSTDAEILETALRLMSGIGTLRSRRMFGGIYIYCNDLFIATVHDQVLYFKANGSTAHYFEARRLRQFSYPRQGEVAKLQYYQAPDEAFKSHTLMTRWAEKALRAAQEDASSSIKKSKRKST